jgi:hypothetical protein
LLVLFGTGIRDETLAKLRPTGLPLTERGKSVVVDVLLPLEAEGEGDLDVDADRDTDLAVDFTGDLDGDRTGDTDREVGLVKRLDSGVRC